MVTVLQSVYGGYDEWVPWAGQSVQFDRIGVMHSRPHLSDRMAAKVAKCQPWRYADDDIVIWVDGSIVPTTDRFVEHLVDSSSGPLSQYPHPHRDCIEAEAIVSAGMVKYQGQPVIEQAAAYMQAGHPKRWGLWATGIIVYRRPFLHTFGNAWLTEQCAWTVQDQISQPYLLRRYELRPTPILGDIFNMDHATIRPHASDR